MVFKGNLKIQRLWISVPGSNPRETFCWWPPPPRPITIWPLCETGYWIEWTTDLIPLLCSVFILMLYICIEGAMHSHKEMYCVWGFSSQRYAHTHIYTSRRHTVEDCSQSLLHCLSFHNQEWQEIHTQQWGRKSLEQGTSFSFSVFFHHCAQGLRFKLQTHEVNDQCFLQAHDDLMQFDKIDCFKWRGCIILS